MAMAKVKDFNDWHKILFEDRAILRSDVHLMNWQQIKDLGNLKVVHSERDEEGNLVLHIYNY